MPNRYQANFEGITRALWDLGTVLSGDISPPVTGGMGPYPPGWNIDTGDYWPGLKPGDGSLWFDTRQGVTLVYCDTVTAAGEPGWYQMNGAAEVTP